MNTARVSRAMAKATVAIAIREGTYDKAIGEFAADAMREFFDENNRSEQYALITVNSCDLDEFLAFLRAGAK